MKRIFTLSAFAFIAALFLSSCIKEQPVYINENYWLSKERGEVVYSDSYCSYYVVQTYYGYTIIRSYGSYKPYERSILYGDFSHAGTKDIYNRTTGIVFTGTVTNYWLTYTEALAAMDYYCPLAGKNQTREFLKAGE